MSIKVVIYGDNEITVEGSYGESPEEVAQAYKRVKSELEKKEEE